jgi:hypothetical protein
MKRLFSAAILACVCASPARADVTVRTTNKGPMGDTPSVQYIKGTKMRVESSVMGRDTVTIVDATARQMISLDPATRQATIFDLGRMGEQIQQSANPSDVKVSMKPTGQTRQLLGRDCAEYLLAITFSVTPPDVANAGAMIVTIGGPMWVARDAPGTRDFQAFYRAASEGGLFFAPGGRGGRGNPGVNERGMAAMYKAYADTMGIPYEQQIEIKMAGSGPMAEMMRGRGGPPTTTITVTGISTDPIPDDKFEIPAGYSRRNQ